MQDSLDELRRALKSVPEYERHAKIVEVDTQPVILPKCAIRSSLVLHPVILGYSLDSTKVYKAMLKLLEVRKNENKKQPSGPYGAYFTCCTCGVESPFVPENHGVTCPVCGMSQAGYISYDAPYRQFEDEETRGHWSDISSARKDNERTLERWTTIQHFSTCFPKLGSVDLDKALQRVNELSIRESIRNLNIVVAAALLLVDNPDILTKRQIRIVEPEKPSYACKMCGRSYFDHKTAKHCCESKGIYKRHRNCQNNDMQTWFRTNDVIVKVSRCNLFSYSRK
jgi:hypothetical protein